MVKYEYLIVNTGFASLEDTITKTVAEGWRLVSVPNYNNILKCIFEKEATEQIELPISRAEREELGQIPLLGDQSEGAIGVTCVCPKSVKEHVGAEFVCLLCLSMCVDKPYVFSRSRQGQSELRAKRADSCTCGQFVQGGIGISNCLHCGGLISGK
jgi:hypothetical protein